MIQLIKAFGKSRPLVSTPISSRTQLSRLSEETTFLKKIISDKWPKQ